MKKLISEFTSCWGGATVPPTAEVAVSRRHRRTKRTAKLGANWKPRLNAIAEDSPISDAAERRRPLKSNHKSPPPTLPEDHWKYSQMVALPAFAPTSYLF
ncbi:hypothetical protein SASPL_113875 [Salvia splendens]|uniref:Uncharacterized protein n=1 Tax=Salvia splendens TaxID=180675 RepID=A0A8X9A1H3_SALSN|nr:hypothetical protein SASPL_113875 [Salvia splendens]